MRNTQKRGNGGSASRMHTDVHNYPFERSGSRRQWQDVWRSYGNSQSRASETNRSSRYPWRLLLLSLWEESWLGSKLLGCVQIMVCGGIYGWTESQKRKDARNSFTNPLYCPLVHAQMLGPNTNYESYMPSSFVERCSIWVGTSATSWE